MTITKTDVLPLRHEQDIVLARQAVRRLTQDVGFGIVDQTKVVTATSELARNAVIYGLGGVLRWEVLVDATGRNGLRLHFIDEGPGIPDLQQAMTDGWTSGTGMGLGLSGAKRLVSDFEIDSVPGRGTRVTITRWK
ncbi:MAG: anti-sigma regulatory factor [Acidobacteriota bacterium]